MICKVCCGSAWEPLPDPHPSRSLRSDCTILSVPLQKQQCERCGLVQKSKMHCNGGDTNNNMYAEEYDLYGSRPGAGRFDVAYYSKLAKAIVARVHPFRPDRALEAGCGNGSLIRALGPVWPETEFSGIEPVPLAVKDAHKLGLEVIEGMIGRGHPPTVTGQYDLVYSTQVIEHTEDPVAYIRELKAYILPTGILLLCCPDASAPNSEILYADHLYSFLPLHVDALLHYAGFEQVKFDRNAARGVEYFQMIVARPAKAISRSPGANGNALPVTAVDTHQDCRQLLERRREYLHRWSELEHRLLERIAGSQAVYCFGAGQWAALIASYAPAVWRKVVGCIIDGGAEKLFLGKPVLDYARCTIGDVGLVLAGINPATQPRIASRLRQDGYNVVTWYDIIAA